jgi:hypothetical protein
VLLAEDVFVAGGVVVGGVVTGDVVTGGVVTGGVVVGGVVTGGVVTGGVVTTGVVGGVVYSIVLGGVTSGAVDRLAGGAEGGHVTLTGCGPMSGDMYAVPLAWSVTPVPLVPREGWPRH